MTTLGSPNCETSLWKKRFSALALRIVITTSSMCHVPCAMCHVPCAMCHVPFAMWPWSIPADAICKVLNKAIDPKSDRFSADNHAPRGQQILHIGCAQGKAVVDPNSLRNNLSRITKALQAWQINWNIHGADVPLSNPVNNLTIPLNATSYRHARSDAFSL